MAREASGMRSSARRSATPINSRAAGDSAQRPTTRTTRSQSREVQAGTRQTRAASRESSAESDDNTRSNSRREPRKNELPPLGEEPEADSPVANEPLDGMDEYGAQQEDVDAAHQSVGAFYATFSQEEIRLLDTDDMLESLPLLDSSADRVLGLVVPKDADRRALMDIAGEMMDLQAPLNRRLDTRLEALQVFQKNFGSQRYALPDIVLRSLLKLPNHGELLSAPWRPDDIIFKANLAALISSIATSDTPQQQAEMLESLDHLFPNRFMLSLEKPDDMSGQIGESALDVGTCLVALDIRTQLATKHLELNSARRNSESADVILAKVFLDVDHDGDLGLLLQDFDRAMLRPWDMIDGAIFKGFVGAVVERIKALRAPFQPRRHDHDDDDDDDIDDDDDNGEVDYETAIAELSAIYSWEDFQIALLTWIQSRHQEILTSISSRGGADRIIKYLVNEVTKRRKSVGPLQIKLMLSTPRPSGLGATPRSTGHDLLRELEANSARSQSNSRTTAAVDEGNGAPVAAVTPSQIQRPDHSEDAGALFVQNDENDDRVDDESDNENVDPHAAQLTQIIEGRSRRESERSRFADRQEGAEKVAFNENFSQSQAPRLGDPSQQSSSRAAQKRPYMGPEDQVGGFSPSQDGGFGEDAFQVDDRPHEPPLRRPLVAVRPTGSASSAMPPPPAVGGSRSAPRTSLRDAHEGSASPPKRQRGNPGQAMDPLPPLQDGVDRPDPTQLDRYMQVSQQNKANRPPARIQTRTPFSFEEVNRLLNLIETHGASYAMIKKIDEQSGNVLHLRDAEALRFKARNMKVEFLKGGLDLPEGFHGVAIGKKEIDQLSRWGVAYEYEQQRFSR